jgi:shikimate kinase
LRADLDVLARRVARKNNRPLLRGDDPLAILKTLAEQRHPVYAGADIIVDSAESPHSATVSAILEALEARGT